MSEPKMSKYAAKVAARRAEQSASIALNVIARIARIERGECVQPKTPATPKPAKPKTPPPEPRGLIADLGDAPAECAYRMRAAEKLIREALEVARVMQNKAKRGRQAGEVLSLIGIIAALPDKATYAALRAEGVPNTKGDEE